MLWYYLDVSLYISTHGTINVSWMFNLEMMRTYVILNCLNTKHLLNLPTWCIYYYIFHGYELYEFKCWMIPLPVNIKSIVILNIK